MKTTKITLQLFGIFALFVTSAFASPSRLKSAIADSADFLTVTGRISMDELTEDDEYKVELFTQQGRLVDIEHITIVDAFKFKLSKGQLYTIKVSQNGFTTKKISVSTRTLDNMVNRESYAFYFEVSLNQNEAEPENDSKDLPVAFVYFNGEDGKFDFIKSKHTDDLKNGLINPLVALEAN